MRKAPLPAEGLQVLPGSLRPLQALSELGALAAGVAGGLVRLPSARAEMPAAPLAWVAAGPNYGSSPARPGASREPSHRHLPMLMVSTTTPFPVGPSRIALASFVGQAVLDLFYTSLFSLPCLPCPRRSMQTKGNVQ